MPELWFGPDGSLDFTALPDGDPDGLLPILPTDELAALHEVLAGSVGSHAVAPIWLTSTTGFAAAGAGDHGDALAEAMGGVHHDGPAAPEGSDSDHLIDPWTAEPDSFALGHPLL